ncbi:MAG: transposase [Acidimicrobiia bacterium]|nr:transposase [Acidimicrobiia bacterium]
MDRELFLSLAEARWVVDCWRLDYNHRRPHSALDCHTPAEFAAPFTPDPIIQSGTWIGGRPIATNRSIDLEATISLTPDLLFSCAKATSGSGSRAEARRNASVPP